MPNRAVEHSIVSPVKMFLSIWQTGYSNRQQRQPCTEYKSGKCEVSGRYFVVGDQMAGCWHILTSNPRPLCYRCVMFSGRNTRLKYMNFMVIGVQQGLWGFVERYCYFKFFSVSIPGEISRLVNSKISGSGSHVLQVSYSFKKPNKITFLES